jgi:5'/3'-nucleotidase
MNRFTPVPLALGIVMVLLSTTIAMKASALNILLSNDDGLTSNLKALYVALKKEGHDVIVSAPCQGQSGMGGAIRFLQPLIPLTESCLNNAASAGEPGAGKVSKQGDGFDYSDFYYVNGTPIMSTAYGLDVLAPKRWQTPPDLVISGPNEGRNAGPFINSSGTVSNVQFAAGRGIPALALSGGTNSAGKTADDGNVSDNPVSAVIATQSARFVGMLEDESGKILVSPSNPLNVNFPDDVNVSTPWVKTRIGTYSDFSVTFVENLSTDPVANAMGRGAPYPGITLVMDKQEPLDSQASDEAYVSQQSISVSVMQVSFDAQVSSPAWLLDVLARLGD